MLKVFAPVCDSLLITFEAFSVLFYIVSVPSAYASPFMTESEFFCFFGVDSSVDDLSPESGEVGWTTAFAALAKLSCPRLPL